MKKILIVAQSLDGFIAQSRDQVSTAWTSEADRQWFSKISREIGLMIMGRKTYETIGRPLPGRVTIVMTRDKEFAAKALDQLPDFVSGQPDWEKLPEEERVYKTGEKTLTEVLATLRKKNVEQVAICGGASVYRLFLETREVDEMYITIESTFLGAGIKLFGNGASGGFPLKMEVVERFNLSLNTEVWHLAMTDRHCEVSEHPQVFAWLDSIKDGLKNCN
jgi:dihydrofolate reductase